MIEDDEGHARLIERNIRRAGVNNDILPFADGTSALAFLLARALPGGLPILHTGVGGSLLGAYLTRGTPVDREVHLDDAAREVA